MKNQNPQTIYLKDYQPPLYLVEHTSMTFQILKGDDVRVTSKTQFIKNHDGEENLVLNGEHLVLKNVTLNDKRLESGTDFQVDNETLTLPCPGDSFTLEITTQIDPEHNTALEGLYLSQGNFCTQCEAQGFRRITYYLDRPDVLSKFTVRIEADKATYPVLLSNGNLIEEGDLDQGRHYTLWDDPFSKPCYLFALVAGTLVHIKDEFTTKSGRTVDLRIYVREGDQGQCRHAMESLKKAMKWDEDVYGREYELDRFNIVAVSDFNMGAMENTSLNIFNTALVLAHQDTATDFDFIRVEGVIGHEYFHNWTGNRITCRDWFQLSLKEGLTVFRDQEFSSDMNSRAVQRIDDVVKLRRMQFAEDAGPLAHPIRPDNYIEINNFYTMTVYEKGAEVIRMQHTLLGAENYRKGTDLYFERHDGEAVTCEDFVKCMSDASGKDLTGQFSNWYNQAGTPEITARGSYDEEAQTYTLTLTQYTPPTPGQDTKKPLLIPVATGLIGEDGKEIQETTILELTDSTQDFTFENVSSKPVPSILRGFSAPVKLKTDLNDDELRFLQIHDTDGFNRWEAGQTLALRMIGRMLDKTEKGEEPETDKKFITSFSDLLSQALEEDSDKALMARALALPDIAMIAQERNVVDPTMIYEVRKQVLDDLRRSQRAKLESLYRQNNTQTTFGISPDDMAERALKNTALAYLSTSERREDIERAKQQYDTAKNMTDRVAAISALINKTCAERKNVLAHYYEHFSAHALVIDKWFSLQASGIRKTTLEDIKQLRDHEAFNLRNPNRVRALYAAFAMNNPVSFHDVSGKGYAFLTDAILELNETNPQIAARLLTPMREWKRYTTDRQEKMKAALIQIRDTDNLSNDVYEIVQKSL